MKPLPLILLLIFTFSIASVGEARQLQLSEEAKISLITILPGEAPEELFGHSAVRIQDSNSNLDISFNYGTFHFDKLFLPKFIYGDLQYFLSESSFPFSLEHYHDRERPVIEQVLNLSQVQKQDLFEFLKINALEENRYYPYDFLYDNCSTRIRDAFKSVLGEDLQFNSTYSSPKTFRELINQYVEHRPFIHTGINLLLGNRVDQPATSRETMFLPDYLMQEFDHAAIRINGEMQPLVTGTEKVLQIPEYELKAGFPWAEIFTWTLFLTGCFITYKNARKGQTVERWLDVPLFTLTGIVGILILFLWFISLHSVTENNLHLLWAWPLHLFIAPLLYRGTVSGFLLSLYFTLAVLSCIIILPGWNAWSQDLPAAITPLILLLGIRSGWFIFVGTSVRKIVMSPSEMQ